MSTSRMMRGNNDEENNNNNNGSPASHPACASCKHQRKKCSEDCILAPYFPAERNREFQAVHKLFGVSNVTKLVRNVREEDRRALVESLIWEATCRQKDPVLGPLGEYRKLEVELRRYKGQSLNQAPGQNRNQNLPQFNGQMYKQQSGSMAWNITNPEIYGPINNNGIGIVGAVANNNTVDFNHDNACMQLPAMPFGYPSQNYVQGQEKVVKKENNTAAALVPLQQQQSQLRHHYVNAFNQQQQQYYLPGQFNSINSKIMDNTQWERGP